MSTFPLDNPASFYEYSGSLRTTGILNTVTNKKLESQVPDFEGALKKLDSLVEKMEGGELTLEQALKHFEEGVTLARQCQQSLKQAELRVQELMNDVNSPSKE